MPSQKPVKYETYIPKIPFPNILDVDMNKLGIAFQFSDEYFIVWETYPPSRPPPRPPLPAIQVQQRRNSIQLQQQQSLQGQEQEQAQQQQLPSPPPSPTPTPTFHYAWLRAHQIGGFMMKEWQSLPRIRIGPYSSGVEDRGGWWTHHSSFLQQLRSILVVRAQEVDHNLRDMERRGKRDLPVSADRMWMRRRLKRAAEIFFGAMQMVERRERERGEVVGEDFLVWEGTVEGDGNGNGEVVGSNEEEVDKRVDSFVEESSAGEDVAGSSSS